VRARALGCTGSICTGIRTDIPADCTDFPGRYANGAGFMETVGFEPVARRRQYALARVKGRCDVRMVTASRRT
jgi:hypothetical protein